jgi:CRISPR-associated protein Csy1
MANDPIGEFLANRLAEKAKNASEEAVEKLRQKLDRRPWVADAARRAGQLRFTSHPVKFSQPDIVTRQCTATVFRGDFAQDGFVRTGNVRSLEVDVDGNAATLDVYTFLMIKLEDGQTVLDHFRARTDTLRELLGVDDGEYASLATQFLEIESPDPAPRSHGNIKQVYFPVDDEYHLLSVLTPSTIVSENVQRINETRFGEEAKAVREARRKNQLNEHAVVDFPNVLTMHFGGTKPQNISKLNSNNGGKAFLLASLPPTFDTAYVRLPRRNFLAEVRWDEELRIAIGHLHRFFKLDYANVDIRRGRRRCVEIILDWLFFRAYGLQTIGAGWSRSESVRLPAWQSAWLDAGRLSGRDDVPNWERMLDESVAEWIMVTYRKMMRGDAVELGPDVRSAFASECREHALSARESIQ